MGFFDLNIPYRESDRHVTDKPSLRGRRLKLALKAMELGYTGVAYNRILKGVMSESDRCSIVLFPISKLTPSSSAFFASVKLHRDLLKVAVTAPFRQYTRLTVVVDNPAQASALNSGNPVLRSYDIVAVKPTSQNAFDHACQTSEVDIIAIDFLKMSPLRLRQPMVKAAIKRGVYFEITYSGLIADAESKRQIISNCKLLVDWTQGKNLIICSAAPSVTELRGPQDAANLFFLLGLTTERAKAAISSNCRSLLAKALRKKHFYKEAVKVEEIPSGGQSVPVKSAFDDWLKWDPISSGQGDVLLDDMEKSLTSSKTVKENVKAINFSSNLNGLPSHGFQIKDLMHAARAALETPDADKLTPALMETEGDASDENFEEKGGGLNTLHEKQQSLLKNAGNLSNLSNDHKGVELPEVRMYNSDSLDSEVPLGHVPETKPALLCLSGHNQVSGLENLPLLSLPTFNVESADTEEMIHTSNDLEANHSDDSEQNIVASKTLSQDSHQEDCLHGGGQLHITKINTLTTNNHVSEDLFNPVNKSSSSVSPLVPAVENVLEMGVGEHEGNTMDKLLNRNGIDIMQEHPLADGSVDGGQYNKMTDSSIKSGDELPLEGSSNVTANFEPISDDVMIELKQMDSVTDYQGLVISQAGMNKRKGKSPHQPFLFPFKRALKPRPFKRKHRK